MAIDEATAAKLDRELPPKIEGYLQSKGWDFRPSEDGKNWQIQVCCFCNNPKWNLEVDVRRGVFSCYACGEGGNFTKLRELNGDAAFTVKKASSIEYVRDEDKIRKLTKKAERAYGRIWHTPAALAYARQRGFDDEAIDNFQLGCVIDNDNRLWLTIPHWVGNEVVNIKYRSITGKKDFRQEKSSAKVLYNANDLEGAKKVILVEGELKAAALWQVGFRGETTETDVPQFKAAVVGITMGAGVKRAELGKKFPPEWVDVLERAEEIYLCLDNDEAGKTAAEKISLRLGLERCKNITLDGAKDPDEWLFEKGHSGHEFAALMKKSKLMDLKNVVSVAGSLKRLEATLMAGEEAVKPMTKWRNVNRVLKCGDGQLIVIVARPKIGKCHARGTRLLRYDGSFVNVEDLSLTDELMGPDSRPRRVLGLGGGTEPLYRIVPKYGDPWVCNESHVLSLRCQKTKSARFVAGETYEMTVREYLDLAPSQRAVLKLWKVGVEFPEAPTPYDPYWVGLWLGDGTVGETHISKPHEIFEPYFAAFARENQLTYAKKIYGDSCPRHTFTTPRGSPNPLKSYLETLVATGGKRIPRTYLVNSSASRRRLLAGLLDSDGALCCEGRMAEWTTASRELLDDFLYLARSLGFRDSWRVKVVEGTDYYRVILGGDFRSLPLLRLQFAVPGETARSTMTSRFEVEALGEGEYFGFELDGDHLYLLGDFTVTHNTTLALNMAYYWTVEDDEPTLFMCMEMNDEDLSKKTASLHNRTDEELLDAMDVITTRYDLRNVPLYFTERVFTSDTKAVFDSIRAAVKRYGIRRLVFDNLHFLARVEDKMRERIGVITQGFKMIAEELRIPIFLIAHPKKNTKRGAITSDDLRESGTIHADADAIIVLHRDRMDLGEDGENFENDVDPTFANDVSDDDDSVSEGILSPMAELIVDATRRGRGGRALLYYEGSRSFFREPTREEVDAWKDRRRAETESRLTHRGGGRSRSYE